MSVSLVVWSFRWINTLSCQYVISFRAFCRSRKNHRFWINNVNLTYIWVIQLLNFSRNKIHAIRYRIWSMKSCSSMKPIDPKVLLIFFKSITTRSWLFRRRFINFILVVNTRNHSKAFNFIVVFVCVKIWPVHKFFLMGHVSVRSKFVCLIDLWS